MQFPQSTELVLRSGDSVLGVMPQGNLVSYWHIDNWDVLYRPYETGNLHRCGLPLMIPNFSRLQDGIFLDKQTHLPMHGFGRDQLWQVLHQSEDAIALELKSSPETSAIYPYNFTFRVFYGLKTNGERRMFFYRLTMENHGQETMPVAPGWHPYFTVAQEQKAQVIVSGVEGFSAQDWDWDQHPPDQAFPFRGQVQLGFPQGVITIEEITQGEKRLLSEMQIWSEAADKPDHNFICFEPVVVGGLNGLNRPDRRLEIAPGETKSIELAFQAVAGSSLSR